MTKKINITVDDWQLDVVDLIAQTEWSLPTNRSEVIRGLLSAGLLAARNAGFVYVGGGCSLRLDGLLDNVQWFESTHPDGVQVLNRAMLRESYKDSKNRRKR